MLYFKSEQLHRQTVKKIQQSIRAQKGKISLRNSSPSNALRSGHYKAKAFLADISELNGALALDLSEGWMLVEPRITMRALCQLTLQYGMIPSVVPEFASITVGGAVMGSALESSSHRFGQFNDICLEYELILGNGELIRASAEENSDIFYGISGSYGTLAILTQIKLALIRAKKYVHLSYKCFSSLKEIVSALTTSSSSDFVEGVVMNRSRSVAVLGEMKDSPPPTIYRQNHFWSPWYYQYIHRKTKKGSFEGGMLLKEYLFRLDRGAFWIGRYVLSIPLMLQILLRQNLSSLAENRRTLKPKSYPSFLFRLLFGAAMGSQHLYKIWHQVPNSMTERLFFIHDFYAPRSKAHEVLEHFLNKTEILPIWLCPVRSTQTPQFLAPHYGPESFINIGIYGIPRTPTAVPTLSRELENEIVRYGGRKMLYSYTYYDQSQFANIYHEEQYVALRKKFYAELAFPTLYSKIKTSNCS